MDNLLIGCKVKIIETNDYHINKEGIVVDLNKDINQQDCLIIALDDGQIVSYNCYKVRVNQDDVNLLKEFHNNKIKRLKLMEEKNIINRADILDFG